MEKTHILTIGNLADYPMHIATVSRWVFDQWSSQHGESFEDVLQRTKDRSRKEGIPMTLIALEDGVPVGTVAVWENDLESRQDLAPYLATLFVSVDHRGKGIGRKLIKAAMQKTKELGYQKLYLIAEPAIGPFYKMLGWRFLSDEKTRFGEPTTVWVHDL